MNTIDIPRTRWLAVSFLMGSLAAGCGGGHRISLPHPGVSGTLELATVVRGDFFGERPLNLPHHSLDDEVTLARLDGGSICFHARLRALENEVRPSLAAPSDDVLLQLEGRALAPRLMEEAPLDTTVVQGTEYIEEPTGEYEMVCTETNGNGDCIRSEPQAVTRTVAIPVDHVVFIQTALFCFENDGSVTPSTPSLELHVGRAHFGFDLSGPAPVGTAWPLDANGAPRPIVAPGYEATALLDTPTAGGSAPVAIAAPRPEVPSDLGVIPVEPMRLSAEGRAVIEVNADGTVVMAGLEGLARIDGGVMRDQEGAPVLALRRDGSVWGLLPRNDRFVELARIGEDGRVRMTDGSAELWVDRRGALHQERGGRRSTANASVSPRLRTAAQRQLGGLVLLLVSDRLAWR